MVNGNGKMAVFTITAIGSICALAMSSKFYGEISIKYENGNAVLIRKQETLKPIGINHE